MRFLKNEEWLLILLALILPVFFIYNVNLLPTGAFKGHILRANDFFTRLALSGKALPKELNDIVIVAMDNHSLKQEGMRWPWSRALFADLVRKINEGKPKAIFLDFAFLNKSGDEAADAIFAEELKKADNVILAGYFEEKEFTKPYELFTASARGVGFVNKKPETSDSMIVHRAKVVSSEKEEKGYSAEINTLAVAKGIPLSAIRYGGNRVILSPPLSFAVDADGTVPINYAFPYSRFANISVHKVLDAHSGFDPSVFKDKIVLVGITALITHDTHMTPLGRLPGIYINAYTMLMFLSGDFTGAFPFWPGKIILFICVLSLGLMSFQLKEIYAAIVFLCFTFAVSAAYLVLRVRTNVVMDIFSLLFLPGASYVTGAICKYAKLITESQALKRMVIFEPATATYASRYFRVSVQHALMGAGKRPEHFFCLARINEFELLKQKRAHRLAAVIKMISETIRANVGNKSLIARAQEGEFVLCVWNAKRGVIEKSLSRLCRELEKREFIIDKEPLKLSLKIAAIDFPRDNIKRYDDLVSTCRMLLERISQAPNEAQLAIFDPERDKLIISGDPADEAELMPEDGLGYVRMDVEERAKELEAAVASLTEQQKKIEEHYFHTMHSLVKALEEKDPYTAGHSERVGFYATELAKGMGLSPAEIDAVNKAAYLHDIGKIGLPDKILHKNERLTEDEFVFIKRHLADGAKILEGLPFYEQVVRYILYHHERYDGKGYPYGLSGEMIPVGAQIIAISDAFDAMTTGRGYNEPLGVTRAIDELKKCSGTQFNPACVKAFVELLEGKKIYALTKTPLKPHT